MADSVENWDHEASYKSRTVLSTIEAQRINHRDTPSPSPSNPRIQELWSKTIRKRTSSVFSTADHPRSQASSRIYVVGADTSNAVDTISHRFDELEKGRCTPQLEHPQLEHCPLQLGHDEQEQPPGMLASGLTLYLVEWAWICWTLKKYLLNLYLFVF